MNCCCCATQTEECCKPQSRLCQKRGSLGSLLHIFIGPSPDEVFMHALDTILFIWGSRKLKNMTGEASGPVNQDKCCPPPCCPPLPCSPPVPCCPPLPPTCSATSLGRSSSFYSMCCSSSPSKAKDGKRRDSPVPSSPKSVCFKAPSSRSCAAISSPRQRTPRVDFKHPADDIRKKQGSGSGSFSMKDRLMQAEIFCSAACQAIKTRCKSKKSPRANCKGQKWLWTRLIHTKNGCQVYEVYKDSDADSSPSKIGCKPPSIVFVVLRNGKIMPFETIKSV